MLDKKAIQTIEEILKKGGSVEVRKRKGQIVIVEICGKLKYTINTDE